MKRSSITAFYMETLLLILVFIGIILILTRVFGIGKKESEEARLLTSAVLLSENAAEAFSASDQPEKVADLLNIGGNTRYEEDSREIRAFYRADMTPDPEGDLRLVIFWNPEKTLSGTLVTGNIRVFYLQEPDPLYTLDTAVFLKEVTS